MPENRIPLFGEALYLFVLSRFMPENRIPLFGEALYATF